MDNDRAKKPDVVKAAYEEMFNDCVKHGVLFAAGDANQTLERGILKSMVENF